MVLEVATLASEAVAIIAPALRYLLSRSSKRAADKAADELGDEAWEAAKRVWGTIGGRIESIPGTREAARDLASDPDDQALQTLLESELRKLLRADQNLARRLAGDIGSIQITTVRASGHGFAAARDIRVSGGIKFGGGDTQLELWSRAGWPAKALIVVGFCLALVGVGGFLLTIALTAGSTEGPNESGIRLFFALGVVGILVTGVGSLIAMVGLRSD
jgi:hypothetical protein